MSASNDQTLQEILFQNKDWADIETKLNAFATDKERVEYLAAELPGLASLAGMTKTADRGLFLQNVQQIISQIFAQKSVRRIPGGNLGLGFSPMTFYPTIPDAILANSSQLTPAKLTTTRDKTEVYGGCKAFVAIEVRHNRSRQPVSFHVDLVIVPNDPRDGEPFCTYSGIDSHAFGISDDKIEEIYHYLLSERDLIHSRPRSPTGQYELMLATAPPSSKLGDHNVIEASRFANKSLTFNRLLQFATDSDKVLFETMGMLEFTLDKDAFKRVLCVRRLIAETHELGGVASIGAHVAANSCVNYVAGLLQPEDGGSDDLRALPLDEAVYALVRDADNVYWTGTPGLEIHSFLNNQGVIQDGVIPPTTKPEILTTLANIFSAPTMQVSHNPERVSFKAQYIDPAQPTTPKFEAVFEICRSAILGYLGQVLNEHSSGGF